MTILRRKIVDNVMEDKIQKGREKN